MADTILTCRRCGHRHTQADWEYQAGHCHACGAPLEIPHDDPSYTQWVTGPKSKAAVELEQAAARAAIAEPHPGPLPPPGPAMPETQDVLDYPQETDDEDVGEGMQVPDDIQVDETGRLIEPDPEKKPKRKKRK